MRSLVFGGGAIGGLVAWCHSRLGDEVLLVCRSNLSRIRATGITLETEEGHKVATPTLVTEEVGKLGADVVYVTCKADQNQEAASQLSPLLARGGPVILLQNGLHNERPFLDRVPSGRILRGIPLVTVRQTAPGALRVFGRGRLVLGLHPTGEDAWIDHHCQRMDNTLCAWEYHRTISRWVWDKMITTAAFNPVSVLAGGVSTARILGDEPLLATIRDAMQEVASLASADGHHFTPEYIEGLLSKIPPFDYKTSMLHDYERSKPMEIQAILGNALDFARQNSLETPVLRCFYSLLRALDRRQGKDPHQ